MRDLGFFGGRVPAQQALRSAILHQLVVIGEASRGFLRNSVRNTRRSVHQVITYATSVVHGYDEIDFAMRFRTSASVRSELIAFCEPMAGDWLGQVVSNYLYPSCCARAPGRSLPGRRQVRPPGRVRLGWWGHIVYCTLGRSRASPVVG